MRTISIFLLCLIFLTGCGESESVRKARAEAELKQRNEAAIAPEKPVDPAIEHIKPFLHSTYATLKSIQTNRGKNNVSESLSAWEVACSDVSNHAFTAAVNERITDIQSSLNKLSEMSARTFDSHAESDENQKRMLSLVQKTRASTDEISQLLAISFDDSHGTSLFTNRAYDFISGTKETMSLLADISARNADEQIRDRFDSLYHEDFLRFISIPEPPENNEAMSVLNKHVSNIQKGLVSMNILYRSLCVDHKYEQRLSFHEKQLADKKAADFYDVLRTTETVISDAKSWLQKHH